MLMVYGFSNVPCECNACRSTSGPKHMLLYPKDWHTNICENLYFSLEINKVTVWDASYDENLDLNTDANQ